jgi:hypothetical protein
LTVDVLRYDHIESLNTGRLLSIVVFYISIEPFSRQLIIRSKLSSFAQHGDSRSVICFYDISEYLPQSRHGLLARHEPNYAGSKRSGGSGALQTEADQPALLIRDAMYCSNPRRYTGAVAR